MRHGGLGGLMVVVVVLKTMHPGAHYVSNSS